MNLEKKLNIIVLNGTNKANLDRVQRILEESWDIKPITDYNKDTTGMYSFRGKPGKLKIFDEAAYTVIDISNQKRSNSQYHICANVDDDKLRMNVLEFIHDYLIKGCKFYRGV